MQQAAASRLFGLASAAPGFNGKPKSKGYVPRAYGYSLDYNEQRPFFRLVDVERMRRDPRIQFGLRILRAPLHRLKWVVKAKNETVRNFVDRQLKKIWSKCLIKLSGILTWGYVPGEWTYNVNERGFVTFKELLPFHPFDSDPLISKENQQVGLELSGLTEGSGKVRIGNPRYCWAIHDQEYNEFRGRSRLINAWTPWMEKTGRHGALDIRRLWFLKNAYDSGLIRCPVGSTEGPDGTVIDNEDKAREIIEKMETGATLVFPGNWDSIAGAYEWILERPESHGDVPGMRDYPKDLDMEILIGMGIPPEIVQTTGDPGSGYAGRSVPAGMFYITLDETVTGLVHGCIDPQCLRPMARQNFGAAGEYEIELVSLLPEEFAKPQPGDPNQPRDPNRPEQRTATLPNDGRSEPGVARGGTTQLNLAHEVAEEARRKYPLGAYVLTTDGRWARTAADGVAVDLSQVEDEGSEVDKAIAADMKAMADGFRELKGMMTLKMSMADEPREAKPDVHIHMPDNLKVEMKPADVHVSVEPTPVTIQNAIDVSPTPVTVANEINPTPVTVTNEVQPTPVQITNEVHPADVTVVSGGKKVIEEEKDRRGNATGRFVVTSE